MTTVVRLRDAGPAVPVRLTGEQARLLAAEQVVEVRPGQVAGTWLLRADRKVGAARIGDIDLYIAPKVPVGHLLFLAGYARDPKGWRRQTVPVAPQDDLVPALAEALWRQVDRAIRPGLRQGYQSVEAASTVLRGRLLETRQLSRRFAQPTPLEVQFDELTADIAENRILVTALERMLRVPGVRPESRRMLRHLAGRFLGVRRIGRGEPNPEWQPSRLNLTAQPALRLAELVLTGTSIRAVPGGVAVFGLLLDMASLVEDFLTIALRQHLEREHGGRLVAQPGDDHLDEDSRVAIRPDLVWQRNGRVAAVIDAKYKNRVPAADAYQMLAYCTAYGLRCGYIVSTAGVREPLSYVVRNSGTEIRCHSLDLASLPAELLAAVAALAESIGGSAHAAPASIG